MYSLSLIRFIIPIFLVLSLGACATSNTGLSTAEDTTPRKKIHKNLQKYIDQLYSDDATERAWAIYNIGKAHKKALNTVPYLVAMLGDNDVAVMNRYIGKNYTLGSTTTPADEAVRALGKIGQASVKPLLNALKNSDKAIVLKAIKALGLVKDSEAIKPLAAFLASDDKRIRLEAANSLSRFRNPWVSEYLLKALKNKDPAIRSTALYAIGKRKNPVTIPTLLTLFNDPDINIRLQVLYIISKFRDERVILPVLKQLDTENTDYRIEVITVLGNIRDYRVIEKLIKLLGEDNKKVRIAAAESLSQIAEVSFGINQAKWKDWWKNKLKRAAKH